MALGIVFAGARTSSSRPQFDSVYAIPTLSVLTGGGIGGFIFPWLINAVLEVKGFPWLCRVWALLTAVVFSTSILFIKPRVQLVKPVGGRGPWFPTGGWSFAWNPLFLLSVGRALHFLPVCLPAFDACR